MKAGIEGYGVYVPKFRIKVSEIAKVWGKIDDQISSSLKVDQKSVSSRDEDSVTQAFEAALRAIDHSGCSSEEISVCMVGSESHPYAVNPTSTIVGEFLNIGNHYLAADMQFACKGATSALISALSLVQTKSFKKGLIIGSDKAQSKPHDILEYTAASAAAAFILGSDPENIIAQIIDFSSYSSDTPDFWRRDGVLFPSHGGRFTGEPAYFAHVYHASKYILEKNKLSPSDFSYCVFHMPNGKFPRQVAKKLGFSKEQLANSLIIDSIGNPYTASSLCGLAQTLDNAKKNELIFMASYGSGAGSDVLIFQTTPVIEKKKKNLVPFQKCLENSVEIDYLKYLRETARL